MPGTTDEEMTRGEALALYRELHDMIGVGPGGASDHQRRRLAEIRLAFRRAPEGDSYLREQVSGAYTVLDIWLSPRRWQQWGHEPAQLHAVVENAVEEVRRAVDALFPESTGGAQA